MRHVGCGRKRIVGEAAISGIPAIDGIWAQGLPSRNTPFTLTAGCAQPRQTYTVTFFDAPRSGSDFYRDPYPFVAGNEGEVGLDGPVTIHGVQVCVAYP